MKRLPTLLLLALSCTVLGPRIDSHAQSNIWINTYYGNWMQGYHDEQGRMTSDKVDYSCMNFISHFSTWPNNDGSLNDTQDNGNLSAINSAGVISKAHAAGVKVVFTVGGWATDGAFRSASSNQYRAGFVHNLVQLCRERGYDGIDLDWEPMADQDTSYYRQLVNQLYDSLGTFNPRKMLNAAAFSSYPQAYTRIWQKFDQINIMTYDLSGPWGGWVTWHNTPIYAKDANGNPFVFPSTGAPPPNCEDIVNSWHAQGIPYSKLGIGIDWYGYDWSGGTVTGSSNGVTQPRQSWTNAPNQCCSGGRAYYLLMNDYVGNSNARFLWDAGPQSSYISVDASGSANDHFVSYDNQQSILAKIAYARQKGLGGLIIWELGGGYRDNLPAGARDSLLQTLKTGLSPVQAPASPTPSSPTNGATGVSTTPTLTWNTSSGATSYGLQISTSSSFSTTVVNQSGITATSYDATGLATNTHYYWRVNAANAGGTSAYSTTWSFTTTATVNPPTAPTLASPVNGATGVATNPTLSWNASSGATSYRVQLSTASNFGSTVIDQSAITATSYAATGLSSATQYYWRVSASNAGGTSSYSNVWQFQTGVAGTTSEWIYRENIVDPWMIVGNGTVTLQSTERVYAGTYSEKAVLDAWQQPSWHSGSWGNTNFLNPSDYSAWEFYVYVSGASGNEILYIHGSNDSSSVEYPPSPYIQTTVTRNQWTRVSIPMSDFHFNGHLFTQLNFQIGTAETVYFDEMRLVGSGGSPPSPPSAPSLSSPANGATGIPANPTLSWNSSSGATSYGLQVSTSSNFFTTAINQTGITTTSYAANGLANNTYYWRVNASNAGGTSAWSSSRSFTTAGNSINHSIVLPQGWNMVSSFVQPNNVILDSLLVSIKPQLEILKNGGGQVYWPAQGINAIGNWDSRYGYQIYMNAADTLTVTGGVVVPETTPIPLVNGANIVAYLRYTPMQVDSALTSIASNLIIVKNNDGEVYWPSQGINSIGSMKPGQGYQVQVAAASILTYPANSGPTPPSILTKQLRGSSSSSDVLSSKHYLSPVSKTGATAVLLVQAPELSSGDEIAVWTSKRLLVGSGVMSQGKALITTWGDNSISEAADGATNDELLSLTVWSYATQREETLTFTSITDGLTSTSLGTTLRYKTDAVWIASVKRAEQIPTGFMLFQNYPNPFNPSSMIKYGLPFTAMVSLEVYNILGQRIATLVNGEQEAGYHEVVFENSTLGSGVYFYRLSANNLTITKKMMVVR